ncbi:MAG: hypothetical protein AB2L22_13690 [Syntrophales bacterium]
MTSGTPGSHSLQIHFQKPAALHLFSGVNPMPWDNIGSVNTGQMPEDEPWIRFCLGLALRYVKHTCGDPPSGCTLEIMTDEDGSPALGIWSEFTPTQDYVRKCEDALFVFNRAVDWYRLQEHFEKELIHEDDEDDPE